MADAEAGDVTDLPGDLQQIIGAVQSADPDPVVYMVLDPAVPSGTWTHGRDGLGKKYVRVPAAALDGVLPDRPRPGSNGVLGAVWGIKVIRRGDLPKNWPYPLADVDPAGYARKPIQAAAPGEVWQPPARGGPWYDQLARAVLERSALASAFREYRELLDGSGVDPYREPMFDRVWCEWSGRGDPSTTFGLEFGGIAIKGELHRDAGEGAGGWPAARRMLLEDTADRLFDDVEERRNPYHDFVAFAERWHQEQMTRPGVASWAPLSDWQRRFAESVERGDADVTIVGSNRDRKSWVAEVMKAFDLSRHPA